MTGINLYGAGDTGSSLRSVTCISATVAPWQQIWRSLGIMFELVCPSLASVPIMSIISRYVNHSLKSARRANCVIHVSCKSHVFIIPYASVYCFGFVCPPAETLLSYGMIKGLAQLCIPGTQSKSEYVTYTEAWYREQQSGPGRYHTERISFEKLSNKLMRNAVPPGFDNPLPQLDCVREHFSMPWQNVKVVWCLQWNLVFSFSVRQFVSLGPCRWKTVLYQQNDSEEWVWWTWFTVHWSGRWEVGSRSKFLPAISFVNAAHAVILFGETTDSEIVSTHSLTLRGFKTLTIMFCSWHDKWRYTR